MTRLSPSERLDNEASTIKGKDCANQKASWFSRSQTLSMKSHRYRYTGRCAALDIVIHRPSDHRTEALTYVVTKRSRCEVYLRKGTTHPDRGNYLRRSNMAPWHIRVRTSALGHRHGSKTAQNCTRVLRTSFQCLGQWTQRNTARPKHQEIRDLRAPSRCVEYTYIPGTRRRLGRTGDVFFSGHWA